MCSSKLSFIPRPSVPYFSTLSQRLHNFQQKSFQNKTNVLFLSTKYACKILFLKEAIITHFDLCICFSLVKYPLLLSEFNED